MKKRSSLILCFSLFLLVACKNPAGDKEEKQLSFEEQALADSLSAFTIRRTPDGVRISEAVPFATAAAAALGIDRLRVIDTGLDPVTAQREQSDDGNNTLALAPGVVVAYERTTETNARLADAGIEVLPIAAGELGTGRGGPRCMSCPAARDPL